MLLKPPSPPPKGSHPLLGKPVDPRWYRLVTTAAEALPPDNPDRIALGNNAELAKQLQKIVATVKDTSTHPDEYREAIQELLSDADKIQVSSLSDKGWLGNSLARLGQKSLMKWLAYYILDGTTIHTAQDFRGAAAAVLAEFTWGSMPLILLWVLGCGIEDVGSEPPMSAGEGDACFYYGVVMPARETLLDRIGMKGPASVVESHGEDSDSTIEIVEDTYTCRSCGSSLQQCRCSHGGALLGSVENIGSPVLKSRARNLTVSGMADVLLSIFE